MAAKPPPSRPRSAHNVAPPSRLTPPVSQGSGGNGTRKTKKFETSTWETSSEGKRIIVYADSGMGKTTLVSLLKSPKFIDFRGGSDKILHPATGAKLTHIPGVETFDDVRDVCNQPDLLVAGDSLVIDTGTAFEDTALAWTMQNVPHEKGKRTIKRIEDYGYGKGYRHLYDTMKLPLADFDTLIRRGVDVVITCQMQQISVANSGGEDFLCDVPKLQVAHGKNNNVPPVWGLYVEWADHVLKIGYGDLKAEDGKAASSGAHVVYVHGEPHYKAKSRTIPHQYPIVTFSEPTDDTIWQFLYDEAWRELEAE